jgi:DNA-binding NarL/FixJ family response regulator
VVEAQPKTGVQESLALLKLGKFMPLTTLETRVIKLRARGLSIKEAADAMQRSPYSMKRALERIYLKTCTHSTLEALFVLRFNRF